jgi:hypothetical protein
VFKLGDEPGFAHPWLPYESNNLAMTVHGLHQPLVKYSQFTLAPNEWAQKVEAGHGAGRARRSELDHRVGHTGGVEPSSNWQ